MSVTRSGIENDPPSAGSGEGSDHVGSVGGALITPQRIGAAIGIAMIGTALFGGGSGHSDNSRLIPSPTHAAQSDTVLTPIFVLAARPAISRRRPWSGSSERRVRRFAAFARPVLAKVQALLTEAVLGAAAGADGPLAALGLTKPADWSAADRTNDILPHLGYGAAAYVTLRALDNYT